ncbi:hypothetical protein G6F31_011405 [Rhizopus arrhizus]|nr:hypothetical protein G6F31_011405 [Rhizopus arrhizus]
MRCSSPWKKIGSRVGSGASSGVRSAADSCRRNSVSTARMRSLSAAICSPRWLTAIAERTLANASARPPASSTVASITSTRVKPAAPRFIARSPGPAATGAGCASEAARVRCRPSAPAAAVRPATASPVPAFVPGCRLAAPPRAAPAVPSGSAPAPSHPAGCRPATARSHRLRPAATAHAAPHAYAPRPRVPASHHRRDFPTAGSAPTRAGRRR